MDSVTTFSSAGVTTSVVSETGSDNDVSVGVYTGSSHPLTEIKCIDEDNGVRAGEITAVSLNAGTTYHIKISSHFDPYYIRDIGVEISDLGVFPNNLSDALVVNNLPFIDTIFLAQISTVTNEPNENVCLSPAWWYALTPTANSIFSITANAIADHPINPNYNSLKLGVYTGSNHPLTEVVCLGNNNGIREGEATNLALNANTTYYIRVGADHPFDIQDVSVSISDLGTFPDNLSDATVINTLPFINVAPKAMINTVTNEPNEDDCSTFIATPSWWYAFTPVNDGLYSFAAEALTNSPTDEDELNLGIYTGSSHPLTNLVCTDIDYKVITSVNMNAGVTYYIRVGAIDPDYIPSDVKVTVTNLGAFSDNLSDAYVVNNIPFSDTTTVPYIRSITNEPNEIDCGGRAWWYAFTPTTDNMYLFKATASVPDDSDSDLILGLFTGSSHPLTELRCWDKDVQKHEEFFAYQLDAGTTYYIRVEPWDYMYIQDVYFTIETIESIADDLVDAVVVNTIPFVDTTSSVQITAVTDEPNEDICENTEAWWYKIVAVNAGAVTITAEAIADAEYSSDNNITLGVYTGSNYPLTEITCIDNDNGSRRGEVLTINLNANTTYYIRVGSRYPAYIQDVKVHSTKY